MMSAVHQLGETQIVRANQPSDRTRAVFVSRVFVALLSLLLLSDALTCWAQEAAVRGAAAVTEKAAEPAFKARRIPTSANEVIEVMGLWLIPYIVGSIVLVWFSLERLVVLRRGRVIPRKFVLSFLDNLKNGKLDQVSALAMCDKNGSPIAQLFAHGIRKWGRPEVEVEQALMDGGERQVAKLRKHIRSLNGISVIMPMVGLLGTVVGMIEAFNDIASVGAMGNAELLANSVGIAFLSTACGLSVAISALTVYLYMGGRVESLVMEMDELGQQVAYYASAEVLQSRATAAVASVPVVRARPKEPVRQVVEKT